MSDELFNPEAQEQIETAAGSVHFWRGKKLYPFSFERNCAYDRISAGWWGNLECYSLIVFLCTLGEELIGDGRKTGIDLIESAEGVAGVKAFRRRYFAWADASGLTGNNPEGIEVAKLGEKIWEETKLSRFKPEGSTSPNA